MVQEEFREHLEFGDGVVGALGGLGAFYTFDADAYVGHVDHVDVVGTVADGGCCVLGGTQESDHFLFLFGGDAAGDDGFAEGDEGEEVGEGVLEGEELFAGDDKAHFAIVLLPLLQCFFHTFLKHQLPHILINQPARISNINRRLLLIPRQHPNLNPCKPQTLYGFLHIILQLILDRRSPQQHQILLDQLLQLNRRHITINLLILILILILFDVLALVLGEVEFVGEEEGVLVLLQGLDEFLLGFDLDDGFADVFVVEDFVEFERGGLFGFYLFEFVLLFESVFLLFLDDFEFGQRVDVELGPFLVVLFVDFLLGEE